MKLYNRVASMAKSAAKFMSSEMAIRMMLITVLTLFVVDPAQANPIRIILTSELASSLIKWVSIIAGLVTFVDAVMGVFKGEGGFFKQTLFAVILFGFGAYYSEIVNSLMGAIGG